MGTRELTAKQLTTPHWKAELCMLTVMLAMVVLAALLGWLLFVLFGDPCKKACTGGTDLACAKCRIGPGEY